MFKQKSSMASGSNNETIIAQGVTVEGDFSSQGDVLIDGEVTGSVQTSQMLRVGETAKIRADVIARSAVVSGEIEGNLRVEERLDLTESSHIHGDISATILSVAAGASINGRVSMNGEGHQEKEESVEEV